MRIIEKKIRERGRRGRRTIMAVAAAGLTATALTVSTSAASSPPAATVDYRIGTTATDASASPPAAFIAVTPVRILDTRPAPAGPVGVVVPAKLGPGARLDLPLAGDGLIVPATATGVLINITIDEDATLPSYITVWPMGEPQPFSSANNAYPGLIQANSLVARLGSGGISIFNQRGSVNVVVDLVGYTVPLASLGFPHSQLQSGSGAPSSGNGDDGDFYLDTANRILYGPKSNGTWPSPGISLGSGAAGSTGATGPVGPTGTAGATGARGPIGAAGSQIFSGTGAPVTLHGDGDHYIDTPNGDLYKQTNGAWGLATSLRGPQGSQGIVGGTIAALGTFTTAAGVTPFGGGYVLFDGGNTVAGVDTTSISHSNATDSFTLAPGSYRVSYRLDIAFVIAGSGVQLELTTGVTQTPLGAPNTLTGIVGIGASVIDTVLVTVNTTSTLRLKVTAGVTLSLGASSIAIEKIA